jgi:hypothetical protein
MIYRHNPLIKIVMNKLLLIPFIVAISFPCFGQQKDFEKKIYIEINERASFFQVDNHYKLIKDTIYHSNTGFYISPGYDTAQETDYIVISYPNFICKEKGKNKNICQQYVSKKALSNINNKGISDSTPFHINIASKDSKGKLVFINGKNLAIKKSDFELLNKTTHYSTSWGKFKNYKLSSGVMTVPFKFRPQKDTTEFSITTDITIGAYIGITKRLSSTKRYYMTIPATLGLSFININNNNTSDKKFDNTTGVVPGITWSTGIIFQIEDFNLGFVVGQDFASEVGTKWKYNGEPWFSFAIGYNFIKQQK